MDRRAVVYVALAVACAVAPRGVAAESGSEVVLDPIFFDGFETGDTVMWSNGAPALCDAALALADPDPVHGARALGICQTTTTGGSGPGLISAQYQRIDGVALAGGDLVGFGLLPALGANVLPLSGARLLGLSSGTARAPGDPGYVPPSGLDRGNTSTPPPGFPFEAPWCPGVVSASPHDSTALVLTLRTPANARSFSVALKLYAYDFPDFVCSSFNDSAVLLVDPPPTGVDPTTKDAAVDSGGNPIGVNSALLQVCTPTSVGGHSYPCPLGTAELSGTGFEGRGATGWVYDIVPVAANSVIQLVFAVWDSGDGTSDTTLLVDDFRWSADAGARVGLP